MNLLTLSLAHLRHQPLAHVLHLTLMALGTALIATLLLIGNQLRERLTRDAHGIDLVIGARGSPLQLVLSSVYHLDVPTGNIALAELDRWSRHPQVERAIPIALGDSVRGYRIVGTTPALLDHYGAQLVQGEPWAQPMQAVVGAEVARQGLRLGARFVGAHGFDGGPAHEDAHYTVSGVLAPTGTVLDRLILTALDSVWHLHDEGHAGEDHVAGDDHNHDHAQEPDTREITAVLLRFRSPLAAALLPRAVQQEDGRIQAVAPAQEMLRLFELLGLGLDALKLLAGVLVLIAGLSIFAALYNAMETRQYDLAILSALGASRARVISLLWLEALLLALAGTLLGLLLGHAGVELAGRLLPDLPLSGRRWLAAEWGLLGLALGVATLSALLPALRAHRTDVAAVLSRG